MLQGEAGGFRVMDIRNCDNIHSRDEFILKIKLLGMKDETIKLIESLPFDTYISDYLIEDIERYIYNWMAMQFHYQYINGGLDRFFDDETVEGLAVYRYFVTTTFNGVRIAKLFEKGIWHYVFKIYSNHYMHNKHSINNKSYNIKINEIIKRAISELNITALSMGAIFDDYSVAFRLNFMDVKHITQYSVKSNNGIIEINSNLSNNNNNIISSIEFSDIDIVDNYGNRYKHDDFKGISVEPDGRFTMFAMRGVKNSSSLKVDEHLKLVDILNKEDEKLSFKELREKYETEEGELEHD